MRYLGVGVMNWVARPCAAPAGSRSDKKPRPEDSNGPQTVHFANLAHVPVLVKLVADDEASCRYATPPPYQGGGATLPGCFSANTWTTPE